MSSFFTGGPRERPLFPVPEQELYAFNGRHWTDPPREHIVPAVLPLAQPLGRSERTIVALRSVEVWPQAFTLRITVYSRDSLVDDPAEGLIDHRRKPDYNGLLIGVLYADGSRASSETVSVPSASEPEEPVLRAHPVGGTRFAVEHEVFLWPLPPAGPLKLVVQWTRPGDPRDAHDARRRRDPGRGEGRRGDLAGARQAPGERPARAPRRQAGGAHPRMGDRGGPGGRNPACAGKLNVFLDL